MVKYDKCYFYAGYKLLNVKNINLKVSSRIFKKLRKPGRNKSNCFFFGQVYIPCILFVTVSWISFIIDPKVGKENIII